MPNRQSQARAAVAFTVKSGWAAAVLLAGSPATPYVLDSQRIELSDPAIPESRQPYHEGFGTARADGPELSQLIDSVRQFGTQSVFRLLRNYRASGHQLVGAGIIVGSLIDPERIANEHIRIHAREGQLFRQVVEQAVAENDLPCSIWRERDLYSTAARALGQPEGRIRAAAKAMGDAVQGAWRAEQKLAATAGWLLLAAC
jgi:hypothetical protein